MGVYDEWREVLTPPSTLSSKSLRALCKALMISDRGAVTSPRDLHQHIFEVCGQLGLAVPSPVRFADSNWVTEDFAFVVNPATQQLEFWRTDYCGSTGAPMAIWNQWLDGSRKDREWSVYTQPHEYVAGFEK